MKPLLLTLLCFLLPVTALAVGWEKFTLFSGPDSGIRYFSTDNHSKFDQISIRKAGEGLDGFVVTVAPSRELTTTEHGDLLSKLRTFSSDVTNDSHFIRIKIPLNFDPEILNQILSALDEIEHFDDGEKKDILTDFQAYLMVNRSFQGGDPNPSITIIAHPESRSPESPRFIPFESGYETSNSTIDPENGFPTTFQFNRNVEFPPLSPILTELLNRYSQERPDEVPPHSPQPVFRVSTHFHEFQQEPITNFGNSHMGIGQTDLFNFFQHLAGNTVVQQYPSSHSGQPKGHLDEKQYKLLKKAQIQALEEKDFQCPICLNSIPEILKEVNKGPLVQIHCPAKHVYCKNCIEQAYEEKQKCPYCRGDILELEDDDSDKEKPESD